MDEATMRVRAEQLARMRADDDWQAALRAVKLDRTVPLQLRGWVRRFDGLDGLGCWDHPVRQVRLIHSITREDDGDLWVHASFSRKDGVLPTWEQVREGWYAVHPDLVGHILIVPAGEHFSVREVMHVWAPLDRRLTPDFRGPAGSI